MKIKPQYFIADFNDTTEYDGYYSRALCCDNCGLLQHLEILKGFKLKDVPISSLKCIECDCLGDLAIDTD